MIFALVTMAFMTLLTAVKISAALGFRARDLTDSHGGLQCAHLRQRHLGGRDGLAHR